MKISFIIIVYNYEQYIESCVRSCLEQHGEVESEVIVVDDGSTDNTLKVLEPYADRIRLFANENRGLEPELNFALSKATGEYMVRVDADDKLHPDYSIRMLPLIENSSHTFVYPEYFVIDGKDHVTSEVGLPDYDEHEVKARGDFLATGTLYRMRDLELVGFYNDAVPNCGLESFELMLKLLNNGLGGFCLHEKLFYYRQHGTNMSVVRRQAIIEFGNGLAEKYGLDCFQTNENHPWGLKL